MFNVAVVNCNLKNYAGAQNYHFVLIIVCYLRLFFCLLLNSLNELVWSYCFAHQLLVYNGQFDIKNDDDDDFWICLAA